MPITTPFRERYQRVRGLDLAGQLDECTDYLQHPEVLVTEFLESYYLIERESHPEDDKPDRDEDIEEMVLEPFFDSLQLFIHGADGGMERILCAGGAFDPLGHVEHPALTRQGLDYIGMRGGSSRIILGVVEGPKDATTFQLLLRVLNCFAEVASPFQLARMRSQVIRNRIQPDAVFDLHMGLSARPSDGVGKALEALSRDLADVFKTRLEEHGQFEGTLGWIESLDFDEDPERTPESLRLAWSV